MGSRNATMNDRLDGASSDSDTSSWSSDCLVFRPSFFLSRKSSDSSDCSFFVFLVFLRKREREREYVFTNN